MRTGGCVKLVGVSRGLWSRAKILNDCFMWMWLAKMCIYRCAFSRGHCWMLILDLKSNWIAQIVTRSRWGTWNVWNDATALIYGRNTRLKITRFQFQLELSRLFRFQAYQETVCVNPQFLCGHPAERAIFHDKSFRHFLRWISLIIDIDCDSIVGR